MKPVFKVNGFSHTDNYLQWGSRYYFIEDIVQISNDIAEYHCQVDALASWKTGIGSLQEFVSRSYSNYNSILPDMLYPVLSGYTYGEDALDLTTGIQPSPISGVSASWNLTGCFVVGVAGAPPAAGSIGYYVLDYTNFKILLEDLFSTIDLDTTATDFIEDTQKQLFNPFQYIVSCNWFPFTIATNVSAQINFGWWQSNAQGYVLLDYSREIRMVKTITLPQHPEAATRGGYLNAAPFTRRTAYVWTFGQIPLDSMHFVRNRSITAYLDVDLFTGNGRLQFFGMDPDNNFCEISRHYSKFCAPVQLSQVTQNVIGAASSVVGGIMSAFTAPAGVGFVGAAAGIGSAIQSMMPQVQTQGQTGATVDFFGTPKIYSEYAYQAPMDDVQNGRPLCEMKTIGNLSGYIKTENADVDLACTQAERDEIAGFMNSGFFYE